MKFILASTFLFASHVGLPVHAGPVETCATQYGCMNPTITKISESCGATGETCSYQVCFNLDFAQSTCDKGGTQISHGCTETEDGNTCVNPRVSSGGFDYVDWGTSTTGTQYDPLVNGAYCQIAQPGDYVHMLLKDGNGECGTAMYADSLSVINGGGSTASLYCGGTDDGTVSIYRFAIALRLVCLSKSLLMCRHMCF